MVVVVSSQQQRNKQSWQHVCLWVTVGGFNLFQKGLQAKKQPATLRREENFGRSYSIPELATGPVLISLSISQTCGSICSFRGQQHLWLPFRPCLCCNKKDKKIKCIHRFFMFTRQRCSECLNLQPLKQESRLKCFQNVFTPLCA